MISESGAVKIPQDLLSKVSLEARTIFLSSAYNSTKFEPNLSKYHNLILKMIQYYGITPVEKHLMKSIVIVEYEDSDLPQGYFKYTRNVPKRVVIEVENSASGYYGYYRQPNKIVLCPRTLYNIIQTPGFDESLLFEACKNIDATIEHELVHFVQATYLHPKISSMLPGYNSETSKMEYYLSPTEFNPTIKSDLIWFAEAVYKDCTEQGKRKGLQPSIRDIKLNAAIKYWVSIPNKREHYFSFFPSNFFYFLRQSDRKTYVKAVKIFASQAKETVANYIEEKAKVQSLKAIRLDTAFGDLEQNEFTDFVSNVNSFIYYPESRLQDFATIKKYLPRISDHYKVQDTTKLLFVPCTKRAIDMITKHNKRFSIDVIFSNPNPVGTGMMFEFGDLPVLLNINVLTRDVDYINACEKYGLSHLEANFMIADGTNFKFSKNNLKAVYIDSVKQTGE